MFNGNGILASGIRAFVITVATIIGLGIGLSILVMVFTGNDQIERKTTLNVLSNLDGERKPLGTSGPVILQVDITGTIGIDRLTADKISTVLTESREGPLKGDRVKVILLHINSPGGSAIDSQTIYQAVKYHKERYKVPVVAYVDGMCASGGYMIACAADKIMAAEGSLIGSVGVTTSPFFNFSELIDRYGIKALTMSRGIDKDALNSFRPWKPDESSSLQPLMDYTYDIFVNIVTSNRSHITKEKLVNEFGAKMFPANTAVQIGYIDADNYLPHQALAAAAEAAGIKDEEFHVVQLTSKTWVSDLFREKGLSLMQNKMVHQLQVHPDIPPELSNKLLYLYLPY